MSIEALIASTPKRGSAKKKEDKSKSTKSSKPRNKKSPDLLVPIGKWVDYFHDMNDEQIHVIQLRLERLYQVSQSVVQTRK